MKIIRDFLGFVVFVLAVTSVTSMAANPWPAESNTKAVTLTSVDADFTTNNMSGAAWNPVTRTLWLANNYGKFYALIEDDTGSFKIATNAAGTKATWSAGGDLESICQVDYAQPIVYLLDEHGWIREYKVAQYAVVAHNRSWDIRAQCPEINGLGAEGLTLGAIVGMDTLVAI